MGSSGGSGATVLPGSPAGFGLVDWKLPLDFATRPYSSMLAEVVRTGSTGAGAEAALYSQGLHASMCMHVQLRITPRYSYSNKPHHIVLASSESCETRTNSHLQVEEELGSVGKCWEHSSSTARNGDSCKELRGAGTDRCSVIVLAILAASDLMIMPGTPTQ